MAEVLGTASAVAGLISLSGKVLAEGYNYVASVHRAPRELRELLCESAALDTVLGQLQGLSDETRGYNVESAKLKELVNMGTIRECTESLDLVRRSISRCQQITGEKANNFGKRVIWPFKEKETKEILARLSRLRSHLTTALTVDMAYMLDSVHQSSLEIAAGIDKIHDRMSRRDENEDRRALLKWLNPASIDVEQNLREGLKHHHPGTGQWLLESESFISWLNGPSSLLWIHGIPGCGKTVLASSIIESLGQQTKAQSNGLVYFFCDHRDTNKRSLRHFLAIGLIQLLTQCPDCEDDLVDVFGKYGRDASNEISAHDQSALFVAMARRFATVTIVIDALDECNDLTEFTKRMSHCLSIQTPIIRVLATGRSEYSLETSVGRLATHRITLEQNISRDISIFIAGQIHSRIEARKLKIRSLELKEVIIRTLSHHANGMFMWAALQLELISQLTNDKAIRDALTKLPRSLEDTYTRMLALVKDRNIENLEIVRKALVWITFSPIPLTLGQLSEAVSIETHDTYRDIEKMITDQGDILRMLGSLVTADLTQEDPVVSLTHFTLYEYLKSETLRKHHYLSMFHLSERDANVVTELCARYLSFSDFERPCGTRKELYERMSLYRLLDFASRNVYIQLMFGGTTLLLPFMSWLVQSSRDGSQQFLSWLQVLQNEVDVEHLCKSPLAFFLAQENITNFEYLFPALLDAGADPRQLLKMGYSRLHIAAIAGNVDKVAAVLRSKQDLEASTGSGHKALHLAATYGHVEVVKLLLERGASPSAKSKSGSTPFYRAARGGSIPIMKLLYQAGSDVNATTWDQWTPIFEAVTNSRTAAVEWLIHHGADLNRKTILGKSVLHWAEITENTEIIRLVENSLSRSQSLRGTTSRDFGTVSSISDSDPYSDDDV